MSSVGGGISLMSSVGGWVSLMPSVGLLPGLELLLVVLYLSPLLVHLLLQDVYPLLQLFASRLLLQLGIGLRDTSNTHK